MLALSLPIELGFRPLADDRFHLAMNLFDGNDCKEPVFIVVSDHIAVKFHAIGLKRPCGYA